MLTPYGVELCILVRDRAVTEYTRSLDRSCWIEGREGSPYQLRLTNQSAGRIAAVLAVDGVSVLNGRIADSRSPAIILDAGETLTIPGWMAQDESDSPFRFSKITRRMAEDEADATGTIRGWFYPEFIKPAPSEPSDPCGGFKRGPRLGVTEIGYDEARGLLRRHGITVSRSHHPMPALHS
jgi:hypothetical protein